MWNRDEGLGCIRLTEGVDSRQALGYNPMTESVSSVIMNPDSVLRSRDVRQV